MPEFPDTPDDLFLDPFVDRPLIYRLNDSGFELRSVGANGTEDVGGLMELETDRLRPATGEAIGEPDDIIWKWPVAGIGE